MVEGPEDVGAAPDLELGPDRRSLLEALDDRALVGVELGLDPAWADARGTAVTAEMLRLTRPTRGERVLELACGPGGVGLAAAELGARAAR
jgi:predicted RNA methylase